MQTVIVSHTKKFIFAAFNKTGSSSIASALDGYQNRATRDALRKSYKERFPQEEEIFKHISPLLIRQLVGSAVWDECLTFAFVRNPWDRIVSLYHFHNQEFPDTFPLAQQPFEQWVKAGGTGSAPKSMAKFVRDEEGSVMLDFVGRWETLERDFALVCDKIGIACGLPHLNRSNRNDYREYYSDETHEIVRGWAQADIELFHYEF